MSNPLSSRCVAKECRNVWHVARFVRPAINHLSPVRVRQNGFHFAAGHDHRQTFGFSGTDDLTEVADVAPNHVSVEKEYRRQRLVLRRGADLLV